MRLLSAAIGGVLAVGGLYIVVGERLVGTSTDATLNAHLATLRSPIDGDVSFIVKTVGARVNANATVAEVLDSRYDRSRLLDLERTQSRQRTDLDLAKGRLRALSAASAQLATQSDAYQAGRILQLDSKVAESKASLDAAFARLREADSALKRTVGLNERGLQTAITLDRARALNDVAEKDIESAKERLEYLRTELASAKTGVFLGESSNDAPMSAQRIREIDLRIAEITAEKKQIEEQLDQGIGQLTAERLRVHALTSAILFASTRSIVWGLLADLGEFVRRGQDLIRLVDCDSLMITASVSESVYNKLRVGSIAQFRLFGDNRSFQATVTRLGGTGASALYNNSAIGIGPEHIKRYDVALDAPDLATDPELNCAVGRTGRLLFTSGPIAALSKFITRLGF